MKVAKKKINHTSGSLKIEPKVAASLRKYCKENGILVTHLATNLVKDYLLKKGITL